MPRSPARRPRGSWPAGGCGRAGPGIRVRGGAGAAGMSGADGYGWSGPSGYEPGSARDLPSACIGDFPMRSEAPVTQIGNQSVVFRSKTGGFASAGGIRSDVAFCIRISGTNNASRSGGAKKATVFRRSPCCGLGTVDTLEQQLGAELNAPAGHTVIDIEAGRTRGARGVGRTDPAIGSVGGSARQRARTINAV